MSKNNGIGKVKINGVERPFHVNGTRQTDMFCETLKIELDEYWNKLAEMANGKVLTNQKIVIVFLWSALYAGYKKAYRKEPDFTYEDVIDWFEDADASEADELSKPLNMLLEMMQDKKKELESNPEMKKV